MPDQLSAEERRLIDEAIAAGRVTHLKTEWARCIHFEKNGTRCGADAEPGGFHCKDHNSIQFVRESMKRARKKAFVRGVAKARAEKKAKAK